MRNVFTKVAAAAALLAGVSTGANAYVILKITDFNATTLSGVTVSCNVALLAG